MRKLRTVLVRIEITLVILILFFSFSFFVATAIFPAFGVYFDVGSTGHSMDPTILDGALTIWSDRVPFADLKVGDIIIYRVWSDVTENRWATVSTTLKLYKEGEEPQESEDQETQEK